MELDSREACAVAMKDGDFIVTHSPMKKVPIDRDTAKNRRSTSKRKNEKNRRAEHRQSYSRREVIFSPRYRVICQEKVKQFDKTKPEFIPATIVLNSQDSHERREDETKAPKSVTLFEPIREAPPTSEHSYVSESWASVSHTTSFDQDEFEAFLQEEQEKENLTDARYLFMNHSDQPSETKAPKSVTLFEPIRDATPTSEHSYVSESWASVSHTASFDQDEFEAFLQEEQEKGNLTDARYLFMNHSDQASETSIVFCSPFDPFRDAKSDPNVLDNMQALEFFEILDLEDISVEKTINTEDDLSTDTKEDQKIHEADGVKLVQVGTFDDVEYADNAADGADDKHETHETHDTHDKEDLEDEGCEDNAKDVDDTDDATGSVALSLAQTESLSKRDDYVDAELATLNVSNENGKKSIGYSDEGKSKMRAFRRERSLMHFLSLRQKGRSVTNPPKRQAGKLQKKEKNRTAVEIIYEIDAVEINMSTTNVHNNLTTIEEEEDSEDVNANGGNVDSNNSIVKIESLLRAVASLKMSLERYDQNIRSNSDKSTDLIVVPDEANCDETEVSEYWIAETFTLSSLCRVRDDMVDRIKSGFLYIQSIFSSRFCICIDLTLNDVDGEAKQQVFRQTGERTKLSRDSEAVGTGGFVQTIYDEC